MAVRLLAGSVGVTLPALLALAAIAAPPDDIQKAVGTSAHISGLQSFTTEKGEAATLVLYATDAEVPQADELPDEDMLITCPGEVEGVGVRGLFHVGLIKGGVLVNQVAVPGDGDDPHLVFPMANRAAMNWRYYGQGKAVVEDSEAGKKVLPTELVHLADYTGDGHAWEFRLVMFVGGCGHVETLLAGYSPVTQKALLFPIVEGKSRSYWHDNLFPSPTEVQGTTLKWHIGCGDHGNDVEASAEYRYAHETWILSKHKAKRCPK